MNIRIYQVNLDWDTEGKAFKGWGRVKDNFDFSIYQKVYDGVFPMPWKKDGLEGLFVMFNYPENPIGCDKFTGHSLSVSDIVYYKGKYWYCDIIGWKEIG